jgi:hypothetical protein
MIKTIRSIKMSAIIGALAIIGLLAASPAAAVSYNSTYSAERRNTAGSTFTNMSLSASTFCFLTRVGMEETDSAGEYASCKITKGANVWTLEAYLGVSNDADVLCSAICYNN